MFIYDNIILPKYSNNNNHKNNMNLFVSMQTIFAFTKFLWQRNKSCIMTAQCTANSTNCCRATKDGPPLNYHIQSCTKTTLYTWGMTEHIQLYNTWQVRKKYGYKLHMDFFFLTYSITWLKKRNVLLQDNQL
jgi:hypothetical protein